LPGCPRVSETAEVPDRQSITQRRYAACSPWCRYEDDQGRWNYPGTNRLPVTNSPGYACLSGHVKLTFQPAVQPSARVTAGALLSDRVKLSTITSSVVEPRLIDQPFGLDDATPSFVPTSAFHPYLTWVPRRVRRPGHA
jgi:hypothetical protein